MSNLNKKVFSKSNYGFNSLKASHFEFDLFYYYFCGEIKIFKAKEWKIIYNFKIKSHEKIDSKDFSFPKTIC
jgi:hypothetical protein